jgi:hypothetical protein
LVGHAVTYSKLQAKDDWRNFSDTLGLIAISTRKPTTEVISRLLDQTAYEDVYEIDCAGWNVICVVINQAPPEDRNWLWELLRGEKSRWKSGTISAILNAVELRLKKMGIVDPEIEAFESEIIESWLQDLPLEKRLLGLDPADLKATPEGQALVSEGMDKGVEKGMEKVALRMIGAGKSDTEIVELTDLPLNLIGELRRKAQGG